MNLQSLFREAELAALNLVDFTKASFEPRLRLGVTGLSRSGKTVFITALIRALLEGGRLPLFEAMSSGRLSRVTLEPQPDDKIPRFAYEEHVAALSRGEWCQSTSQISEIRLRLEYNGNKSLLLDIVDYPGEWLLDLPLLNQTYREFSDDALAKAKSRLPYASTFLSMLDAPVDELRAKTLSESFTAYLRSCRDDAAALSSLPPGRFLMPGDMAGSPALTFAPLPYDNALMERRFEAYKTHVVYPFFRDHFARLDRQIVLIDAMPALNAGESALNDLSEALSEVLEPLNIGKNSWFSTLFKRRIDKTIIAATKADHVHSSQHARLQKLVARLGSKANKGGAEITTLALASIRATREATITREGISHDCILGVAMGSDKEIAVYPGELPENPLELKGFKGGDDFRFIRFKPPLDIAMHIRLDRVLETLLGDKLR
jgi:uncharacterized protein